MLKKLFLILLAIVLFASPFVVRWLYFFDGSYQTSDVPRPDLTRIQEPLPETQPFADKEVVATAGTVLVDLAHGNHVEMSELNILQARLAVRGHKLEAVMEPDDLTAKLRYARALLIISPGYDWLPGEINQIEEFVNKGGRVLLIADPTRFDVIYDEWGFFVGLDYSAPHINDLAGRFGLLFQSDYLYNTVVNEGNFRNLKLTDLSKEPLTAGLEQIVFFAAHSILSQQPALIAASGDTRSSTSERAEDLTVGLLTADGSVLALGDLTFMIEPYNAVRDNDQFVANIADFLSDGQRTHNLADFPYFFGERVDLVYAGEPILDGDLLEESSLLQTLFADDGRQLSARASEDDEIDTLFFGLYDHAQDLTPYLEAAEVTLQLTPTLTIEGEQEGRTSPDEEDTSASASATVTATQTATGTLPAELASSSEDEPDAPSKPHLTLQSVGKMTLPGTSLLLHQPHGERQVMVVLAQTEEGLISALDRLTVGDLEGCLLHQVLGDINSQIALCPTYEALEGDSGGGWQDQPADEELEEDEPANGAEEPSEPSPSEPAGSVLVVSLDDGTDRYDGMTSAGDYTDILQESFDVTIWSASRDGPPDIFDVWEYDLVIWSAGDYDDAVGEEYDDLLYSLMLEGIPLILSGAYVSDADTEAVQRDLQVGDATHPLAEGFGSEEVIDFVSPPSGQEYAIDVMESFEEDEGLAVFTRGPSSEASGAPAIVVAEDEFSGFRLVFIGFPLYLLPEDSKALLVWNAVSWTLAP